MESNSSHELDSTGKGRVTRGSDTALLLFSEGKQREILSVKNGLKDGPREVPGGGPADDPTGFLDDPSEALKVPVGGVGRWRDTFFFE
jgi:hypothetical protein